MTSGINSSDDLPAEQLADDHAENGKAGSASVDIDSSGNLGSGRSPATDSSGAFPAPALRSRLDLPADPNPLPLFWDNQGLFRGFANGRSGPATSQIPSRGKEGYPEQVTHIAKSSSEIFKA